MSRNSTRRNRGRVAATLVAEWVHTVLWSLPQYFIVPVHVFRKNSGRIVLYHFLATSALKEHAYNAQGGSL